MLTVEEKKFAYNKYFFNSSIDTILNFMYPVSNLDEKIEKAKVFRRKYIGFAAILYTLSAIVSVYYFLFYDVFDSMGWAEHYRWLIFASSVVPFVFIYNLDGPAKDVDNDLNNFIIPFLERIQKYVDSSTKITLITDLGLKLNSDKKLNTETYADSYEYSWFAVKLPLTNDLNVAVDLTDRVSFYGKKTKNDSNNLNVFSDLHTTISLRFEFKEGLYKYFGELDNCEVSWSSEGEDRVLIVKSRIKRNVEFFIPSSNILGLTFDNNYCLNLIDSVYAKLRGLNEKDFTPEVLREMALKLKEKAKKLEEEAQKLLDEAESIEEKISRPVSLIEETEEMEETDEYVEDSVFEVEKGVELSN